MTREDSAVLISFPVSVVPSEVLLSSISNTAASAFGRQIYKIHMLVQQTLNEPSHCTLQLDSPAAVRRGLMLMNMPRILNAQPRNQLKQASQCIVSDKRWMFVECI